MVANINDLDFNFSKNFKFILVFFKLINQPIFLYYHLIFNILNHNLFLITINLNLTDFLFFFLRQAFLE